MEKRDYILIIFACILVLGALIGILSLVDTISVHNRTMINGQFHVLEIEGNTFSGWTYLCYDKDTNVMYYYTSSGGLSPCYTFDGESGDIDAHIARYPRDYEETN